MNITEELTRQVARATLEAAAPLFATQARPPAFEVRAEWRNDGTAGLVVVCERCHHYREWTGVGSSAGSASLAAVVDMANLHGCAP